MNLSMTKQELCSLLSGTCTHRGNDASFSGTEFDSRSLQPGQLFIALPGEKAHGHQFLDKAFSAGAELALVEDDSLLEHSEHKDRLICVSDSLKGYWELAREWRRRFKGAVVAVAGSVGKTSTKEMLAAILAEHGEGTASKKSFNNHIGVPYTMTNASLASEWVVLEMGMNHPGELRELAQIGRPQIGIITCIAPEHTEFFPTLDDVANAECELLEGLEGTLIIYGDDQVLASAVERKTKTHRPERIVRFGARPADAIVENIAAHGLNGISFDLEIAGEKRSLSSRLLGKHSALHCGSAALVLKTLIPQSSLDLVHQALEKFEPPPMRLNVRELPGGRTIIDDAYNSSPNALSAALEIVGQLKSSGAKVGLLLGDMLELGHLAEQYHREIGAEIQKLDPDFLITVGPLGALFGEGYERAISAASAEEAGSLAAERHWDILLVKASRGIGLDKSVRLLLERLQ